MVCTIKSNTKNNRSQLISDILHFNTATSGSIISNNSLCKQLKYHYYPYEGSQKYKKPTNKYAVSRSVRSSVMSCINTYYESPKQDKRQRECVLIFGCKLKKEQTGFYNITVRIDDLAGNITTYQINGNKLLQVTDINGTLSTMEHNQNTTTATYNSTTISDFRLYLDNTPPLTTEFASDLETGWADSLDGIFADGQTPEKGRLNSGYVTKSNSVQLTGYAEKNSRVELYVSSSTFRDRKLATLEVDPTQCIYITEDQIIDNNLGDNQLIRISGNTFVLGNLVTRYGEHCLFTYQYTFPDDGTNLPGGIPKHGYYFYFRSLDMASNSSNSSALLTIFHDTEAPIAPVISNIPTITNTSVVSTKVVAETKSDLIIGIDYLPNATTTNPSPTLELVDRGITRSSIKAVNDISILLGSTTSDTSANCQSVSSYNPTRRIGTCYDGHYIITITSTDGAGNTSTVSTKYIERDTVAPYNPTLKLAFGALDDSGNIYVIQAGTAGEIYARSKLFGKTIDTTGILTGTVFSITNTPDSYNDSLWNKTYTFCETLTDEAGNTTDRVCQSIFVPLRKPYANECNIENNKAYIDALNNADSSTLYVDPTTYFSASCISYHKDQLLKYSQAYILKANFDKKHKECMQPYEKVNYDYEMATMDCNIVANRHFTEQQQSYTQLSPEEYNKVIAESQNTKSDSAIKIKSFSTCMSTPPTNPDELATYKKNCLDKSGMNNNQSTTISIDTDDGLQRQYYETLLTDHNNQCKVLMEQYPNKFPMYLFDSRGINCNNNSLKINDDGTVEAFISDDNTKNGFSPVYASKKTVLTLRDQAFSYCLATQQGQGTYKFTKEEYVNICKEDTKYGQNLTATQIIDSNSDIVNNGYNNYLHHYSCNNNDIHYGKYVAGYNKYSNYDGALCNGYGQVVIKVVTNTIVATGAGIACTIATGGNVAIGVSCGIGAVMLLNGGKTLFDVIANDQSWGNALKENFCRSTNATATGCAINIASDVLDGAMSGLGSSALTAAAMKSLTAKGLEVTVANLIKEAVIIRTTTAISTLATSTKSLTSVASKLGITAEQTALKLATKIDNIALNTANQLNNLNPIRFQDVTNLANKGTISKGYIANFSVHADEGSDMLAGVYKAEVAKSTKPLSGSKAKDIVPTYKSIPPTKISDLVDTSKAVKVQELKSMPRVEKYLGEDIYAAKEAGYDFVSASGKKLEFIGNGESAQKYWDQLVQDQFKDSLINRHIFGKPDANILIVDITDYNQSQKMQIKAWIAEVSNPPIKIVVLE